MSSELNPTHRLAQAVQRLLSKPGVRYFWRAKVDEVVKNSLRATTERARREAERVKTVKRTCVLDGVQNLPKPPEEGKWVTWATTLHVRIRLPDELVHGDDEGLPGLRVFEYVKEKGFPDDPEGKRYDFWVEGWIPEESSPDRDPDDSLPLPWPTPDRPLSVAEKFAVLAAVHDVYWRGDEKIGPRSNDTADKESTVYHFLLEAARELRAEDLPIVQSWLPEIEEEIRRQSTLPVPCGEGNITDGGENEIRELENATPPLSRKSGAWVSNKQAAGIEGVETRTLADYRNKGLKNASRSLGRDRDGRVWRREGTPRSHPWYLRTTLRGNS